MIKRKRCIRKEYNKDGIEALMLIETILIIIFGIVLYIFFKFKGKE